MNARLTLGVLVAAAGLIGIGVVFVEPANAQSAAQYCLDNYGDYAPHAPKWVIQPGVFENVQWGICYANVHLLLPPVVMGTVNEVDDIVREL